MSKRWQRVELAYLKKHAGDRDLDELAGRFHVSREDVAAKIRELRIDASGEMQDREARALADYQAGMAAFYRQEWAAAAEAFGRVVESASGELAARARQFAAEATRRRDG